MKFEFKVNSTQVNAKSKSNPSKNPFFLLLTILKISAITQSQPTLWKQFDLTKSPSENSLCSFYTEKDSFSLIGNDFEYAVYNSLNDIKTVQNTVTIPIEGETFENHAGCLSQGKLVTTLTNKINIFNPTPGEELNLQQLEFSTGDNSNYYTLIRIANTNYIIVGGIRSVLGGSNLKFLKVDIVEKSFTSNIEDGNSSPFGSEQITALGFSPNFFIATPKLARSYSRGIYDHTVDGSQISSTQNKHYGPLFENVLTSPESSPKDLYLSGTVPDDEFPNVLIETTVFTTGAEKGKRTIPTENKEPLYGYKILEFSNFIFFTRKDKNNILLVDYENLEAEIQELTMEGLYLKQLNIIKDTRLFSFYVSREVDSTLNIMITDLVPCHISCVGCTHSTTKFGCKGCKENAVMNSETRICECIASFFYNEETGDCDKCTTGCEICSSGGEYECEKCFENFLLEKEGNCVDCEKNPYICPQDLEMKFKEKIHYVEELSLEFETSIDLKKKLENEFESFDFLLLFTFELDYQEKIKLLSEDGKPTNMFELNNRSTILEKPSFGYSFPSLGVTFEDPTEKNLTLLGKKIKIKFSASSSTINYLKGKRVNYENQDEITVELKNKTEPKREKEVELPKALEIIEDLPTGETVAAGAGGFSIANQFSSNVQGAEFCEFFQIMDILFNFQKINAPVSPRMARVFGFVKKLKFPDMDQKDSLDYIQDDEAYIKYRSGGRNRTALTNKDSFLAYGQNGLISAIIILFYIIFILSLLFCSVKNIAYKFSTFLYRTLLTTFIFQYQMIAVVELESHSSIFGSSTGSLVLKLSPLISILFLIIIVVELARSYVILDKTRTRKELKNMDSNEKQIFEVYTSKLHRTNLKHPYKILLYQQGKYLMMQVVIGGLPLFPSFQVSLALGIELLFFLYFLKVTNNGNKIFNMTVVYLKIVAEEICILFILISMAIFVFFGDTDFKDTGTYSVIEYIAIGSIVFAALFQIVMIIGVIIKTIYTLIKGICCKKKPKDLSKLGLYIDNVDKKIVETEGAELVDSDKESSLEVYKIQYSKRDFDDDEKGRAYRYQMSKRFGSKELDDGEEEKVEEKKEDDYYLKDFEKSEDYNSVIFTEMNNVGDKERRQLITQRCFDVKVINSVRGTDAKSNQNVFKKIEEDEGGNSDGEEEKREEGEYEKESEEDNIGKEHMSFC